MSTSGFVKDNLSVWFFLGVYAYYLCLGMTFVYFCLLFRCFDVYDDPYFDVGLHIINCINGCLTINLFTESCRTVPRLKKILGRVKTCPK